MTSTKLYIGTHLGAQVLVELLHSLPPVILMGQDLAQHALNHLIQLHRHRLQVDSVCFACQSAPVSFLEREGTQGVRAAGVGAGGSWGRSDLFGHFCLVLEPWTASLGLNLPLSSKLAQTVVGSKPRFSVTEKLGHDF